MNQFRLLATILVFALLVPASFAMIKTWSVPDLVRQAEYIVIAKVAQQTEIALDQKTQISTVKNVLIPEKILKGAWAANEPIVLMTRKCGEPGQPGWLEDQPDVPPKGFRVILFLQKGEDGSLQTVNLVQGLWPLDKNKPLGMGFGTTMSQLEDLIKEQKN